MALFLKVVCLSSKDLTPQEASVLRI